MLGVQPEVSCCHESLWVSDPVQSPVTKCPHLYLNCRRVWMIHIKFINQGEWISRNPKSILNHFLWNFTHTIFHPCRDHPVFQELANLRHLTCNECIYYMLNRTTFKPYNIFQWNFQGSRPITKNSTCKITVGWEFTVLRKRRNSSPRLLWIRLYSANVTFFSVVYN